MGFPTLFLATRHLSLATALKCPPHRFSIDRAGGTRLGKSSRAAAPRLPRRACLALDAGIVSREARVATWAVGPRVFVVISGLRSLHASQCFRHTQIAGLAQEQ